MDLLVKTFQSLSKARLFSIMFACALLAIISVCLLVAGITAVSVSLANFEAEWINGLIGGGTGILFGIAGWFVLPAFMVLFAGIFQETTIQRVEATFYPENVRETAPKFWPDIWHDVKFTFKALLLNIIILPLYLFGIGFIISILLNSYLLGHEFFEGAAGYHIGKASAKELSSRNRVTVYGGGFIIALMTLVPILNLFMPIIAIVWMVHAFHRINKVV